jgi:ribose transport system permease protein
MGEGSSTVSPTSADETTHKRSLFAQLLRSNELGILLVLLLLILAVGLNNPKFWTIASLANFGARAAWFGIIALGVVFLLSMGEIDLSTGSIYGLTINAAAV